MEGKGAVDPPPAPSLNSGERPSEFSLPSRSKCGGGDGGKRRGIEKGKRVGEEKGAETMRSLW